MAELSDAEFHDLIAKLEPSFQQAFVGARLGLPGSPLTLETQWGPIEGVKDGNTIRWTLPNHEWVEVRVLADHAMEMYRNDRLQARLGPAEIEPVDEEGDPQDSPGP